MTALDGASFEARIGEVHALLGENGAGKSTLLGILAGLLRPDAGTVEIAGRAVALRNPRDAWAHGIGLVHQHFALVPALSVTENLALGRRGARGGWSLPLERVRAEAEAWMRRTGLDVPLDASVGGLGVGERQRVEILKALLRDPPVLALDEPTAVLAPAEVDSLFGLLRELAQDGRAVVLVAHKIDEVLSVADRVTVLREGRTTLSAPRADVDAGLLVRAMVGRDVVDPVAVGLGRASWVGRTLGEVVASLDGVRVREQGRVRLDGAGLVVHRGEIVGVAGVEGNGQRVLARVLAGREVPPEGTVRLPERVGFVPQDRTAEGLIGDFDLVENTALAVHRDSALGGGMVLNWKAIRARAQDIRERFGVRAPGVDVPARTLSGGNQQRVVVGRELSIAPDLVVAENPTRGLDVTATAFVHEELVRLARTEGRCGVVILSTDLDEVLALADRVLVMVRGRLLPVEEGARTREGIGALMLGGHGGAA